MKKVTYKPSAMYAAANAAADFANHKFNGIVKNYMATKRRNT